MEDRGSGDEHSTEDRGSGDEASTEDRGSGERVVMEVQGPQLPTGDVSFNMVATPASGSSPRGIYYSVDFGDGSQTMQTSLSALVHRYAQAGLYLYTVEAIAVVSRTQAYRTVHTDAITLLSESHTLRILPSYGPSCIPCVCMSFCWSLIIIIPLSTFSSRHWAY